MRHPLYVGWLLAFWATPTMTAAHLVFAVMTTAYILIAIRLEERDLVAVHGATYEEYRRTRADADSGEEAAAGGRHARRSRLHITVVSPVSSGWLIPRATRSVA